MESTATFGGLRIAAFESRRATEMQRLIEKLGGLPRVSPSMREVPLSENPAAVDFAHRLISGQVDIVLLTTGVGTRLMLSQIERHLSRERFLAALSDVTTIARGPKPVAALRDLGIEPTLRVPAPNTWHEILTTIDAQLSVDQQLVALQEYGKPNTSLIAGLEARGAQVLAIKVYDWDLPEDLAPLENNLRAIVAGQIDAVLFTSAHQVVNVLRVAERLGLGERLREAFTQLVVCSIGPTTSEMLEECGLPADLEPEHSKMGQLVVSAAQQVADLLMAKRRHSMTAHTITSQTTTPQTAPAREPATARAAVSSSAEPWRESLFLRACRREPVERTPIWLMRQAGRYMAEYRTVRAKTTFLELCKNPALCAEVMVTAIDRLGVDAAIIFSDLLPIIEPMGLELEFAAGEGPLIHNPVRSATDVDRVAELHTLDSLGFVFETVRATRAALDERLPVIGFAGAPFTLASYIIEGSGSRNYTHTKSLMYRDSGAWHELLGRLARSVARYLNAQIEAGAGAVQLFDSWVGTLGPDEYRDYVLPHMQTLIASLDSRASVIHFATGNPALLPLVAEAGGDVIGVDWRVRLDDAWQTIGHDKAIQGNLDPGVLLSDESTIRRRAAEILAQAAGRPGHIFNLGHGVLPETPVDHVIALVQCVKELGTQR